MEEGGGEGVARRRFIWVSEREASWDISFWGKVGSVMVPLPLMSIHPHIHQHHHVAIGISPLRVTYMHHIAPRHACMHARTITTMGTWVQTIGFASPIRQVQSNNPRGHWRALFLFNYLPGNTSQHLVGPMKTGPIPQRHQRPRFVWEAGAWKGRVWARGSGTLRHLRYLERSRGSTCQINQSCI